MAHCTYLIFFWSVGVLSCWGCGMGFRVHCVLVKPVHELVEHSVLCPSLLRSLAPCLAQCLLCISSSNNSRNETTKGYLARWVFGLISVPKFSGFYIFLKFSLIQFHDEMSLWKNVWKTLMYVKFCDKCGKILVR